jgi:beta-glucanase (GH16 family)
MKNLISTLLFLLIVYKCLSQPFSPDDYCLVWSDEFSVNGAPDKSNWGYEQGYVRNNEAQYYTNGRLENARVENGFLIIEARKDGWQGNEYTSASLVSSGKVTYKYGRFEIRAKIDAREGCWPAFWTLGQSGEWPSNGEIDIMEYYNGKIHANVAWGTETRWKANWDSQNKVVSEFGTGWANEFHIWRMEWTPEFINLYVDDVLMNSTDLSKTINGSISNIRNPFQQPHYILLNLALGGNNGGDPSKTTFPSKYIIDYVRVYQKGNCKLDCNWQEGGKAYLDECLACIGGSTGKSACTLECKGNLFTNPGFEDGTLNTWTGWGTRNVNTTPASGKYGVSVGAGAVEKVVTVQPYTHYTYKVKARKSGGGWFRLGVKEHGNVETFKEFSNTSWEETEHQFITGNSTSAKIYFYNGSGGTAYGDDFEIQLSGCYTIVTGNEALKKYESKKLFPNPSELNFTIETEQPSVIKISDIHGNFLEEIRTDKTVTTGSLLPSGVYIIQISSENTNETFQWIKL